MKVHKSNKTRHAFHILQFHQVKTPKQIPLPALQSHVTRSQSQVNPQGNQTTSWHVPNPAKLPSHNESPAHNQPEIHPQSLSFPCFTTSSHPSRPTDTIKRTPVHQARVTGPRNLKHHGRGDEGFVLDAVPVLMVGICLNTLYCKLEFNLYYNLFGVGMEWRSQIDRQIER